MDTQSPPSFLSGDSEMGAMLRAHDWTRTPLGDPAGWSISLQTAVTLGSAQPVHIAWGPDLVWLYDDGYGPIADRQLSAMPGGKAAHPQTTILGHTLRE